MNSEISKSEKALEKATQQVEKLKAQLIEAKEKEKEIKKTLKAYQSKVKTSKAIPKKSAVVKCFPTDLRKQKRGLNISCEPYQPNEAKVLYLAHKVQPQYKNKGYLDLTIYGSNKEASNEIIQEKIAKVIAESNASAGDILFLGSTIKKGQAYGFYIKTADGYISDEELFEAFYINVGYGIEYAKRMFPDINYDVAEEILHEFFRTFKFE